MLKKAKNLNKKSEQTVSDHRNDKKNSSEKANIENTGKMEPLPVGLVEIEAVLQNNDRISPCDMKRLNSSVSSYIAEFGNEDLKGFREELLKTLDVAQKLVEELGDTDSFIGKYQESLAASDDHKGNEAGKKLKEVANLLVKRGLHLNLKLEDVKSESGQIVGQEQRLGLQSAFPLPMRKLAVIVSYIQILQRKEEDARFSANYSDLSATGQLVTSQGVYAELAKALKIQDELLKLLFAKIKSNKTKDSTFNGAGLKGQGITFGGVESMSKSDESREVIKSRCKLLKEFYDCNKECETSEEKILNWFQLFEQKEREIEATFVIKALDAIKALDMKKLSGDISRFRAQHFEECSGLGSESKKTQMKASSETKMVREDLKLLSDRINQSLLCSTSSSSVFCDQYLQAIGSWASEAKGNLPESGEKLIEALVVMNAAYYALTGNTFRDTQILSALVFLDDCTRGKLCQIGTGEGKTVIVSMVATARVLQGRKVDVITSNSVLAVEGCREKAAFYALFEISVAHNTDDGNTRHKPCYDADICYGDIATFQFDYLRHSFECLGTRGDRCFQNSWCILDEVDSMLVDDGGHIAKLSEPFPGFEKLRYVYIKVWEQLLKAKIKLSDEIEKSALNLTQEEFENHIDSLFSDSEIHLKEEMTAHFHKELQDGKNFLEISGGKPDYLEDYCRRTISKWIENSIVAMFKLHASYQYKLETDESGETRIVLVDNNNTGVTMANTVLSYGIHQFLELKHNLQLTYESLTSCYISNVGYISFYGDRIHGLTGTLGSASEKELLSSIYDINFQTIPTYKEKQFTHEQDLVVGDEDFIATLSGEVLKKAMKSAAGSQQRAVQVVCATLHDLSKLKKQLQEDLDILNCKEVKIRTYQDETEVEATRDPLDVGHVMLSTNIGGRGTDLKTTQEVNTAGGLHVAVAFLPLNQRVQDQAFGRTARQGKTGSACLIIRVSELWNLNKQQAEFWNLNKQQAELCQTYQSAVSASTAEGVCIDSREGHQPPTTLELKELPKSSLQDGNDCGFIALNEAREAIVKYIQQKLERPDEEEEIKNLLLPEMKTAWAQECSASNASEGPQGHAIFLDSNDSDLLLDLYRQYEAAHSAAQPHLNECNDMLGYGEGSRKNICELTAHFNSAESADSAAKSKFEAANKLIADAEKRVASKLKETAICNRYISNYYVREKGWLAFQPSASGGDNSSMIDIVALRQRCQIVVWQSDPAQDQLLKAIYATLPVDYSPSQTTQSHIRYNGINHFTTLVDIGRTGTNLASVGDVANLVHSRAPLRSRNTPSKLLVGGEEGIGELKWEEGDDFDKIRKIRDRVERRRLREIQDSKLKELLFDDTIFGLFSDQYSLLKKRCARELGPEFGYVLKDLKEYWAFWLESNKCSPKTLSAIQCKTQIVARASMKWQDFLRSDTVQQQLNGLSKDSKPTVVFNMHYGIQQADYYINIGQFKTAEEVLRRVIEQEGDLYSAGIRLFEARVKQVNAVHERFWDAMKEFVFMKVECCNIQKEELLNFLKSAKVALEPECNLLKRMLCPAEKGEEVDQASTDFQLVLSQENGDDDDDSNEKVSKDAGVSRKQDNFLLLHLQARMACLLTYKNNIENLEKETQDLKDGTRVAIGLKDDRFLYQMQSSKEKQGPAPKQAGQNQTEQDMQMEQQRKFAEVLTAAQVTEMQFLKYDLIYQLKIVHPIPQHVITGAKAQIAGGIAAMIIGLGCPFVMPIMGPLAGTLIAEGILDIVMELIMTGDKEHDKAEYEKSKVITYGISVATMGLGVLAMSSRILNSAVKCCESIASFMRWLGQKIPYLKGVFEKLAKLFTELANHFRTMLAALEFSKLSKAEKMSKIDQLKHAQDFQSAVALENSMSKASRSAFAFGVLKDVGMNVGQSILMRQYGSVAIETMMEGLKPLIKQKVMDSLGSHKLKKELGCFLHQTIMRHAEDVLKGDATTQICNSIATAVGKHVCAGGWKVKAAILAGESLVDMKAILTFSNNFFDQLLEKLQQGDRLQTGGTDVNVAMESLSLLVSAVIHGKAVGLATKVGSGVVCTVLSVYQQNRAKKKLEERAQQLKTEHEAELQKLRAQGSSDADLTKVVADQQAKQNELLLPINSRQDACVHDACADLLEVDKAAVALRSRIFAAKGGATQEDAKRILKSHGIEVHDYTVAGEDLGGQLKGKILHHQSDRAILFLEGDSGRQGHAAAVKLGADGRMMVHEVGQKPKSLDDFMQSHGATAANILVPDKLDPKTAPTYSGKCIQPFHVHEAKFAGEGAENAPKYGTGNHKGPNKTNSLRKQNLVELNKKDSIIMANWNGEKPDKYHNVFLANGETLIEGKDPAAVQDGSLPKRPGLAMHHIFPKDQILIEMKGMTPEQKKEYFEGMPKEVKTRIHDAVNNKLYSSYDEAVTAAVYYDPRNIRIGPSGTLRIWDPNGNGTCKRQREAEFPPDLYLRDKIDYELIPPQLRNQFSDLMAGCDNLAARMRLLEGMQIGQPLWLGGSGGKYVVYAFGELDKEAYLGGKYYNSKLCFNITTGTTDRKR